MVLAGNWRGRNTAAVGREHFETVQGGNVDNPGTQSANAQGKGGLEGVGNLWIKPYGKTMMWGTEISGYFLMIR